jgi:FlaA1/EpsC-like NDP-sugar epimerase
VVRFGNVLASNGSVVPRFLQQIRAGGPVTVTHPEIRRYFMLISEAVQLVLHTAASGESGAAYVLEMGDQIKLVDLARNLIRLSGLVPDEDIKIVFVGLRPGEKLFEELVGDNETSAPSGIDRIGRVRQRNMPVRDRLLARVSRLEGAALTGRIADVFDELRAIVPEFSPTVPDPAPAAPGSRIVLGPAPARWPVAIDQETT